MGMRGTRSGKVTPYSNAASVSCIMRLRIRAKASCRLGTRRFTVHLCEKAYGATPVGAISARVPA